MKHQSLQHRIANTFAAVIAELTHSTPESVSAQVRPAGDPKFGDYQCNAAMALAKQLQSKPRDIATQIKERVDPQLADVAEPLEIAGPGFLNIRLKDSFLAGFLKEIPAPPPVDAANDAEQNWTPGVARFDRVGIPPTPDPRRVVVEYSQPNIAKQMHVGHLRSTIIGDVFARVLAFQGHDVIRQNHIGDWGTQFGMLIRWYREHTLPTPDTHDDVLEAIEQDYKAANERFKTDAQFAREARAAVGELQGGNPDAYKLWQEICRVSLDAIDRVYRRLGVLLRPEDVRGESYYNDQLQPLVDELLQKPGEASAPPPRAEPREAGGPAVFVRRDQGAVCVFLYDAAGEPLFKNPEGEALPMIIQKSDGAFLYATTDLAAIRFRLAQLDFDSGTGAQRVIYVTDARQKLHFDMWMACARAAGWIPPDARVDHVTFGTVLGNDRKPLMTRAGGTVKLRDLLDEAERRALDLLHSRNDGDGDAPRAPREEPTQGASSTISNLPAPEQIARRVGVAAVKYADLRNDRNSDYVFDWDKMISFQGNTAPYMMYAYARIRSIYRKAADRIGSADVYADDVQIAFGAPQERALALRLSRFPETVESLATELLPHQMCTYLYELATDFMRFYESCPVIDADGDAQRLSRLRLCDLTARTLRLGLGLLGIDVLERM